jgi:hypothetical protein
MALVSLKNFTKFANEITESLSPALFQKLNGGIVVQPYAREEGDYLVMGEYIEDPSTGNMILLYYGSFLEMLGNADVEVWKTEIEETVIHELRHHVESLAGVDDLSFEEDLELQGDSSS